MSGMLTELHIQNNTRSMIRFEKHANGSLKCNKKSNFDLLSIQTVSNGLKSIR